jgi:hypothetical protein
MNVHQRFFLSAAARRRHTSGATGAKAEAEAIRRAETTVENFMVDNTER